MHLNTILSEKNLYGYDTRWSRRTNLYCYFQRSHRITLNLHRDNAGLTQLHVYIYTVLYWYHVRRNGMTIPIILHMNNRVLHQQRNLFNLFCMCFVCSK